jgi:hypothetical protein
MVQLLNRHNPANPDGAQHPFTDWLRCASSGSGELVRAVRSAGLNISRLYGDDNDTVFGPGSPRLLLVAVKK